jgi:PAS domain S-box-containing protein
VNADFERRYGYSRDEVLGPTVNELKIWEDPADRVRMVTQLQKSGIAGRTHYDYDRQTGAFDPRSFVGPQNASGPGDSEMDSCFS